MPTPGVHRYACGCEFFAPPQEHEEAFALAMIDAFTRRNPMPTPPKCADYLTQEARMRAALDAVGDPDPNSLSAAQREVFSRWDAWKKRHFAEQPGEVIPPLQIGD
jgi:hypothetical protein